MACPQCAKEADPKYRPFCSKRCADLDLAKWFDGTYTLASDEEGRVDDNLGDEQLN